MIFSIQIEKHVIGGLVKNPEVFPDITNFVSEKDFFNEVHSTIFSVLNQCFINNEKIDKVILAQKIKNLGITFKDDIDIFEYIDAICFTQITKDGTTKACQELKKLTVRRNLYNIGHDIQQIAKTGGEKPLDQLISECDKAYSEEIKSYVSVQDPKPIYTTLEQVVEEIGNNPPDQSKFWMGPFPSVNRIYGSLLRQGAINLVGARTGAGKTALQMFYLTHVAEKYDVPVLWLDFAEMSLIELQMRAVSMLTGGKVPFHSIESGDWRKNPIWEKMVRRVWPKVKKLRFYYQDIGGMSPDEVISLIRRFYYRTVGRDNRFIVGYDYLKPFNFDPRTPEYKEMGHFIQQLKVLINNEVPASVWASLQLNRSGITNNKNSSDVDDSENSFSLSDRIIQQCTHGWLFRPKLVDEIAEHGLEFGNMSFSCMKHRHLGEDFKHAVTPVKLNNGKFKKNFINLYTDSFHFEDRGDLNELVKVTSLKYNLKKKEDENGDGNLL